MFKLILWFSIAWLVLMFLSVGSSAENAKSAWCHILETEYNMPCE